MMLVIEEQTKTSIELDDRHAVQQIDFHCLN